MQHPIRSIRCALISASASNLSVRQISSPKAASPRNVRAASTNLVRLERALQPATTDSALSDAVNEYLALSPEEQRACWMTMHQRCADVWPRQVHSLAQRVAIASPRCMEWFASVRALCGGKENIAQNWAKQVDTAMAASIRPLYGSAFVQLHQLHVPGPTEAPSSPSLDGMLQPQTIRQDHDAASYTPSDRQAQDPVSRLLDTTTLSAVLAQVKAGETVHKTDDEAAFVRKFGHRRTVHALLHPADPTQLLAVLYTSFLAQPPSSMADIDSNSGGTRLPRGCWSPWSLNEQNASATYVRASDLAGAHHETGGAHAPPTVAAFYSVSSHAAIAKGLRMGTAVIYKTAGYLASTCPSLRTFVTLSPIPEFCPWLGVQMQQKAGQEAEQTHVEALRRAFSTSGITASDIRTAARNVHFELPPDTGADDGLTLLSTVLADPSWWTAGSTSPQAQAAWRSLVIRATAPLVRQYLLTASSSVRGPQAGGGPLCRVAAFHLGNGARMARILAASDVSPAGIARSAGFNVNYRYAGSVGTQDDYPGGLEGLHRTMREGVAAYAASPAQVLASQRPEFVWPKQM